MNLNKEELQKQLNKIIENEHDALIEFAYPSFKILEGKYFKFKNSYSSPKNKTDFWFIYTKITKIEKNMLYVTGVGENVLSTYMGISFQTDKYGLHTIKKEATGYVHNLGEEITEKEFIKAWDKLHSEILVMSEVIKAKKYELDRA